MLRPFLASLLLTPAALAQATDPGATLRVYLLAEPLDGGFRPLVENQTPNLDQLHPDLDLAAADLALADERPGPTLATVEASFAVPADGEYDFELTACGAAELEVDGQPVARVDDAHKVKADTGSAPLTAGQSTLLVRYYYNRSSAAPPQLRLRWRAPGRPFETLAAPVVTTEADPARVTAPGVKQLQKPGRPGDGRPVEGLHPGYTLSNVHPPRVDLKIGGMAFLPDGRLVVGTFSPLQRSGTALPDIDSKERDKLYAISNLTSGEPAARPIADGLLEPAGVCVVGDALYVSQRLEITKLTDPDGDGFYDAHETVAKGWDGWNYHQFTFGLVYKGGKLYAALSTAMAPPKWAGMRANSAPGGPFRGAVIEVDLQTKEKRWLASGLRTPNTVALGPEDELFIADNQGTWLPTSQLVHVAPGRFFGHYNNPNFVAQLKQYSPFGGWPSFYGERLRAAPTMFLPHNEFSNSPTQGLMLPDGPFAGQMLLGELTAGGIRRLYLEKVNGAWQGAAFQFTQGLEAGVNRMAFGPDGALYVGGIGAQGNWAWNKTQGGLQRLVPNGKTAFEMRAVRALPDDTFEIEFTKPVAQAWLREASNYGVQQWTYAPSQKYGGPKIGGETLRAVDVAPSADGRKVRLRVPGARAGYVVYFRVDPTSVDGEPIWATEAWYTLAHEPLPEVPPQIKVAGANYETGPVGVGAEPTANAVTLIGRAALVGWNRGEKEAWRAKPLTQDELAALPGEADVPERGGNLATRTLHGDARLHVEWLSPPGGAGQQGGNSGVYLQNRYEIQVLNNPAPGEPAANDTAGALYKVKPPSTNAHAGPGQWNSYDVWFRAPRFKDGKKTEPARVTVLWNGRVVHNDVALAGPTGGGTKEEPNGPDGTQIGPLVLQAHSTDAEGPVRFRNVWIAPLEGPADRVDAGAFWGEWKPLFDGKTLDGWTPLGGDANYEVVDGAIVGTSRPNTPNTFLTTTRDYGDFDLEFEVWNDAGLNSGVQVRSFPEGEGRAARVSGLQVEIDDKPDADAGGVYDERGRGWLQPMTDKPAARRAFRVGAWNKYKIVARGPVVLTFVNDVPAAALFDAARARGLIGLQVHDVGGRADPLRVRWRNLRVREAR